MDEAMSKRARWWSDDPSASSAADGGGDRLSDLPDPLRHHILTFLPLKSAIRTGALSSRWRDLWRQRWPHTASLVLGTSPSGDAQAFVDSVDRLLCGPRRRLDILSVSFHPGTGHLHNIKNWLDYAADCGVEALHLDLSPPPPPPPPASRRSGRRGRVRQRSALSPYFRFCSGGPALAHLTLCGLHLSSPPSHFKKLTSLEVLNLYEISISDSALRKMTAELPLLRVLDLRGCPELKRVQLPSLRIDRLIIVSCPKLSELTICSLVLRSLHLSTSFLSKYSIGNNSKLEDLYLSCGGPGTGLPRSNWLQAFGALSRIKTLTLCSLSLQYIAISGAQTVGELRNFENLKELQLMIVVMADSNLMDIYSFFRFCRFPRLEKLFIELPTYTRDASMENYLEVAEEGPPNNCFEYLKMIKINSFKGHINEMRLVSFLLSNAAHLESLVVVAPREHMREEYSKNKVDCYSDLMKIFHTQLSLMTKASANAHIALGEHDYTQLRSAHDGAYFTGGRQLKNESIRWEKLNNSQHSKPMPCTLLDPKDLWGAHEHILDKQHIDQIQSQFHLQHLIMRIASFFLSFFLPSFLSLLFCILMLPAVYLQQN